jgi:hypothetical protein
MSYTGTLSQAANQTAFNINTGTVGSPTYTIISEITDFSQSGKQNKTATATNLQSTADEFISTIQAPGSFSLTFNRVSADTGQAAVVAAFGSKVLTLFQVVLPKTAAQTTSGDKYAFNALVEQMDDLSSISPDKQIQSKATLKVSGSITFTAGS